MSTYDDQRRCRSYLLDALTTEMDFRYLNPDTWVENERLAITTAANVWAESYALAPRPTVGDVERIEQLAVGHVDYASKLALYVTEMLYGYRVTP